MATAAMTSGAVDESVQVITIIKEVRIAAPIEVAFEALLEEMGPARATPDGMPFPMVIEPRPGGRWFRDLGGGAGHLWAHVQVIKPPTLLELCGPLFMSYPAANHVQYRLAAEGDGTRLTLTHRGMGQIPPEVGERLGGGWGHHVRRVGEIAERLGRQRRN